MNKCEACSVLILRGDRCKGCKDYKELAKSVCGRCKASMIKDEKRYLASGNFCPSCIRIMAKTKYTDDKADDFRKLLSKGQIK